MALAAGMASYLDAATLISVSVSLATWRDHFGLSVLRVGLLTGGLAFAIAVGSWIGGWWVTASVVTSSSSTTWWCSYEPQNLIAGWLVALARCALRRPD
jgi:hypothetical protein